MSRRSPSEQDTTTLDALAAVVTSRERLLGHDHPDTLEARHAHAVAALDHDPDDPAAVRALERVGEARTRVLGAAHPDTLTTLVHLTALYERTGRPDAARDTRARIATGWRPTPA